MNTLSNRFSILLVLTISTSGAQAQNADIIVYGATASGVIAAVAAAREGKQVLLLEPGTHLGGMVTGGLGATDTGNRGAIGGYSREFFNRVKAYYIKKYTERSPQVKDCSDGFRFEPHVARLILDEMLAEAKIKPQFGELLVAVKKTGAKIVTLTTKKNTYRAGVFIDATYEGDLMAAAGVKYFVGREGREVYKESLAGVQAYSKFHQWPVKVNGRDEKGKLLPFIQAGPPGKAGQGDKKVQAYNFRLCITTSKDNQVPFPKPPGYDPARYELLARYLKLRPDVKVGQLMNPVRMPNGKTDTNNNGPFSTDYIGESWTYPEADAAGRAKIILDHVHYTQGFLYFLANDPRVPPLLQKEMRQWGLAKDEWVDNNNWPPQIYVREARRMIGEYVMTETDITKKLTKDDSVGLGSYNTDSHHVQRVLREDGTVLNEGDFQVRVSVYAVPYRSLTPKIAECENLLVPVCVSCSHVAYGTVRMEPVYMVLGQAAGVAAAHAIDEKVAVQKIAVEKLTEKLKKQQAVLSPTGFPGKPPTVRQLDPKKLGGIVVDDVAAKQTGPWKNSASIGPYVGEGYLHDNNEEKGKMRIRFVPTLPKAGKYEVRLFYPATTNRARNALVVISSEDGEKMMKVDQRKGWKGDGGLLLGVFNFAAGSKGWVEIRNDGTDGHVIADAVQFVAKGKP